MMSLQNVYLKTTSLMFSGIKPNELAATLRGSRPPHNP